MEITVPFPPFNIPQTRPPSSTKPFMFPPSPSPLPANSRQIQIPLQRPQKPIKKISLEPLKPTCSISDALQLFDALKIPVTADLYLSFIEECTQFRDPEQAIAVHNHIRTCTLRPTLSLYNRLLLMYVSCGCMLYAKKLFEKMSVRSASSWAAVIAGCFDCGGYEEVVDMFVEMRGWRRTRVEGSGSDLDHTAACVILGCVIKACGKTMNLEVGEQVHCWMVKMGYVQDVFLHRLLMSFYRKLGCSYHDFD